MKRIVVGGSVALVLVVAAGLAVALVRGGVLRSPEWLVSLVGSGVVRPVDAGLFCREHGVPEKFCTLCHAELEGTLERCAEHGLPEAICTICHPEAAVLYGLRPLCAEHGLPEFFCSLCNASLLGGEVETGFCPLHLVPKAACLRCDPALADSVAKCAEHGAPALLCVACRPALARNFTVCRRHRLPDRYCDAPECRAEAVPAAGASDAAAGSTLPLVRLARPEVARDAGITVAPVLSRTSAPTIETTGEVAYDESRFARVRTRAPGLVREVRGVEGAAVRQGDVLAVIESAALGEAKADYLVATPGVRLWESSLERLRALSEDQLVPAKEVALAEMELARAKADVLRARQKLRSFGLDEAALAALGEEPEDDRDRLRVLAPIDGTIVRRSIAAGEIVDGQAELFAVADLARLWVDLAVTERDLPRVRAGQPVEFSVDSLAPLRFEGVVTWIAPEIDDRTRSAHVRAAVENAHGHLRVNMFGTARVRAGEPVTSLAVPKDAIQWDGLSFIVFRRREEGVYEPHRVLAGDTRDGMVDLAWSDLAEGDSIVATGSFLLKTEIEKGSIGAGCCGE